MTKVDKPFIRTQYFWKYSVHIYMYVHTTIVFKKLFKNRKYFFIQQTCIKMIESDSKRIYYSITIQ